MPHVTPCAAWFGAMALAGAVRADVPVPPWIEEGDVAPPTWARSVAPKPDDRGHPGDLVLFAGPSRASPKRGVTLSGTTLPFFGEKRGSGCTGRFWLVGPLAWTCSDDAALSPSDPRPTSIVPGADGLWLQYFFVKPDGTSAYATLEAAVEGTEERDLEGGWAVGVAEQRRAGGERWARTQKGLWIAEHDLVAAQPSSFHGTVVQDGRLDFAWVVPEKANVWSTPSVKSKPAGQHARLETVTVRDGPSPAQAAPSGAMVQVDDASWMLARDLARPALSAPPAELAGASERWIDVDLATQTLVAYDGPRAVYATLVSTGRGPAGTDSATPPGVHRIWVKLLASDMDNVEREDVTQHYSMQDVPYVQFFDRGVALHGTYWHRDFGHVHSHGCVNLTPLDARWLFSFTEPALPSGWSAAYPTPMAAGTLVRVR